MAITFFAEVVIPADSSSATNTATQNTITPPSNMKVGDLCFVIMQQRGTATMSVGVTGGQSWRTGFRHTGSNIASNYFWTRFNGSWSANPRMDFSAGTCTTVVMLVFRPSDNNKYWGIDLEPSLQSASAAANITITGGTSTRESSVSLGIWMTADDNTWGSLSGTGWSKSGLTAQYRNTSGSDQSMTIAYNIRTSVGAIANVTQTEATLGNDAAIMYFLVFYERDSDYIGDPTNYAAAFSGGDRMLLHKAVANSNGNGAIMRIKGYSTMPSSGNATVYPVLYRLNGGTYEFCALGAAITMTPTEQWYKGLISYPIVSGTTYFIGYFSLDSFDFRYVFRSDWTAGESFDYYVSNGSLPSFGNISVGAETNTYQTHEAIEIQFTSSLTGAISDNISDAISDITTSIAASGNLGGIYTYSISDSTASIIGKSSLQLISESLNDGKSGKTGRMQLPVFTETFSENYAISKYKVQLDAISENRSDSYSNRMLKGILPALSDSISEYYAISKYRSQLALFGESMQDGYVNSIFKSLMEFYGDNYSESTMISEYKSLLAFITESVTDNYSNSKYKASIPGISEAFSEALANGRYVMLLYGRSESNLDAISGISILNNSNLSIQSDSWNDSYAEMKFRAIVPLISENLADAISMFGNLNDQFAGELRKCVGGILVLADLPATYNNKDISGKKLYVFKDGELKEIKTLSSV